MTVRVRLLNSISLDLLIRIKLEVIEQSPTLDALQLFIDGISLGTRHCKVGVIGKFNNNIVIMDRM